MKHDLGPHIAPGEEDKQIARIIGTCLRCGKKGATISEDDCRTNFSNEFAADISASNLAKAIEVGLVCKVCHTWLPCQLMPGVPGEFGCSCDGCTHSDDAKQRASEWHAAHK